MSFHMNFIMFFILDNVLISTRILIWVVMAPTVPTPRSRFWCDPPGACCLRRPRVWWIRSPGSGRGSWTRSRGRRAAGGRWRRAARRGAPSPRSCGGCGWGGGGHWWRPPPAGWPAPVPGGWRLRRRQETFRHLDTWTFMKLEKIGHTNKSLHLTDAHTHVPTHAHPHTIVKYKVTSCRETISSKKDENGLKIEEDAMKRCNHRCEYLSFIYLFLFIAKLKASFFSIEYCFSALRRVLFIYLFLLSHYSWWISPMWDQ